MGAILPHVCRTALRPSPRGRAATLLLLLLGLGAGTVVRAQAQEPTPRDTARVRVPDVTGLELSEARKRFAAIGFKIGEVELAPSSAPAGTVVRQWPEPGTAVAVAGPGRVLARLTLATTRRQEAAKERATVPDLGGSTLGEARRQLQRAALTLGEVTRVSSEAAAGTVVGQGTPSGTIMPTESPIDLQVSAGPAVSRIVVQMPDLVGRTVAEAAATLGALHLRIVRVDTDMTTPGRGTILRQLPAAGTRVPESTGVALLRGVVGPPAWAAVAPESGSSARAKSAPPTEALLWRRIVLVFLLLGPWMTLAAAAVAMRRRWRRPAPAHVESRQEQAEWPAPAAVATPPARAEVESREVQAEWPALAAAATPPARAEVERRREQAEWPAPAAAATPPARAELESRQVQAEWSALPAAPTPQPAAAPPAPPRVRGAPPSPVSLARGSIELITNWDFGRTALELAGPLEAAPTVPLEAANTVLLVVERAPGVAGPRPGHVVAEGGSQPSTVRAVLAGGRTATDGLTALGASLIRRSGAARIATGAEAADELGARILSQLLTALEIPLMRVLANAWSRYDALREYLDPERFPPERISVVTLAPHATFARFRPVVELRLDGRLEAALRADVGLAIALEGGILWIQGGRFVELRPGRCTVWGGIRCEETTLLQRPATELRLPRIVRFGGVTRIGRTGETVGAGW